jgi:hypothetical protein
MATPKISLHDALLAIKEYFYQTNFPSMTISMYPCDYSPTVCVGDEYVVTNTLWEEGKYERELGFPVVSSTPKTYVAYDKEGAWSATVQADSPQEALDLILDDEGYDWYDGANLCLAEQIMCGTVKTKAVFVEVENSVEENQGLKDVLETPAPWEDTKKEDEERIGELPVGTILEALIDSPVSIHGTRPGHRAVVVGNGNILLLDETDHHFYRYGSGYTKSDFMEIWKILYTPTSDDVETRPDGYDEVLGW